MAIPWKLWVETCFEDEVHLCRQKIACFAGCLANLAMEPAILDDIVQKDGVPFMLQLLRGSPGCLEEGLCFLFLFASKSYDNQVLDFLQAGTI
jgi:hypothetical protein